MMQNFTLLIGRLGLSLIFILSGIGKITAYQATAKLLIAQGVAPGLLPLAILIELGGGLAVLCGLWTRGAAIVLFLYSVIVAVIFHGNVAEHEQWINFMKNLAIAGGFLILAVHGPGALSLDGWQRRRKQRKKIFF